jgi:DinB superfamily
MLSSEIADLYARDLERVAQELRAFPDTDAIWKTAPGVTNAAGTLALHLEGNLREFIGRQVGKVDYTRDRPLEFSARGVPQDELIARIESVGKLIPKVIEGLSDGDLAEVHPDPIVGRQSSVQMILMHMHAHLNYHLGQIDYLRRITTGDGAIQLAALSK